MWGPDDTTDLLYVWVCGPGEGGGGGVLGPSFGIDCETNAERNGGD